jgi:hypothetical protein
MVDFNRAVGSKARPGKASAQPIPIPVPYRGVNTTSSLSMLAEDECHYAYNILPSQDGFKTRLGTSEWTNGVTGSPRTTIPYHALSSTGSGDKLFVTGTDGIYEVTTSGAGAATRVYNFVTTGATAGYGNFIQWGTATGAQWIFYADSANGLLSYEAATNTWSPVTGITGLNELDIRYVAIHKLRIWVILKDSPNGWYLPGGAMAGAATEFQFGSKFTHGGDLVSVHTFTRDSGNGPDDLFVAISRQGDVIIYQGADPSAATTFSIVGTWYVGVLPDSRKVALEYSGDIYILSINGITSLTELLRGTDVSDNYKSVVGKITNLLRSRLSTELSSAGWELIMFPAENLLIIQSPIRSGSTDQYLHYCLNTVNKGWGFFRNVQSTSMGVHRNELFYTQSNGSVWRLKEGNDQCTITNPVGTPVEFTFLTAYSNAGAPGVMKMPSLARPVFVGSQAPEYAIQVLFDYERGELSVSGSGATSDSSLWDTALWDSAIWGGDEVFDETQGVGGVGYAIAVAMRGRTTARLTLAEITLIGMVGGYQ